MSDAAKSTTASASANRLANAFPRLPGFDPRAALIESRPLEPALPGQALLFSNLEKLFARMHSERGFPQWSPELLRDRRRPPKPLTPETVAHASVLITLVGHSDPTVVFTRRTDDLSSHAGQISFPGGRAEPEDVSHEATALREAHEEIGLHPAQVRVLGRLPQYVTATGFCVTPVIGHVDSAPQLRRDAREVAEIFQVPLSFLTNPANHEMRILPAEQSPTGERIRFYAMPYSGASHDAQEFFIWGATAAMLRNLYHLLWAAWQQRAN